MMNFNQIKGTKFYKKFKSFMSQGLSPRMLALSIAIGVVVGLMPLLIVNTWFILLIALFTRINIPLALFINYAIWPIHMALILPFIKLGCWIREIPMTILDLNHFKGAFSNSFWLAFQEIGNQIVSGMLSWSIISLPIGVVGFFIMKYLFRQSELLNRQ